MRRFRTWLALAVGLCLPLAALGSPATTSATRMIPVSSPFGSSAAASPLPPGRHPAVTSATTNEGALDPTDGIEFQDNGNAVPNCNNQLLSGFAPPRIYTATCDEPADSLSVGDHVITANFYGDGNYQPATATLVPDQVVQQATTTTTITSPSPGTLITYGNESQLFFNVNVAGVAGINQSPTGNVERSTPLHRALRGPEPISVRPASTEGVVYIERELLHQRHDVEPGPLCAHGGVRR